MKAIGVMFTGFIVMILNLIIYASLLCGGFYFVLWALKQFNIIAG